MTPLCDVPIRGLEGCPSRHFPGQSLVMLSDSFVVVVSTTEPRQTEGDQWRPQVLA